ncbi:hypothetical protein Tco_0295423 [Tanacetum coccineum]
METAVVLFSLYMAVFGQPTSVPVIWLPFTNRNSDQPQTSEHGCYNTVNPAYEVSTVSPSINTACPQDLEKIHEDDLEAIDLKWQLSLLSMRAKRYGYCKNYKKIVKTGQTRTRERIECTRAERMLSRSTKVNHWSTLVNYQETKPFKIPKMPLM